MNAPDPASLQNLNDIVLPADVGWWPLASGWYYLVGFLFLVVAWFIYIAIQSWRRNRYRRTALNQLQLLIEESRNPDKRDTCLRQIPALLKRTALSIYPRSELASLSGKRWYDFLNSKVSTSSFTDSTASLLEELSYSVGDLNAIDTRAVNELFNACSHWLKHHQPDQLQKPAMET